MYVITGMMCMIMKDLSIVEDEKNLSLFVCVLFSRDNGSGNRSDPEGTSCAISEKVRVSSVPRLQQWSGMHEAGCFPPLSASLHQAYGQPAI